jgi:hypothetical protein
MLGITAVTATKRRLHGEALGGDQMLRRIITWALVLFIVFYVATQPTGAAGFVHHAYNGLHDAANSMAQFVNSL